MSFDLINDFRSPEGSNFYPFPDGIEDTLENGDYEALEKGVYDALEEEANELRKVVGRLDQGINKALAVRNCFIINREASVIRTEVCLMISRGAAPDAISEYVERSLPKLMRAAEQYKGKSCDIDDFKKLYSEQYKKHEKQISEETEIPMKWEDFTSYPSDIGMEAAVTGVKAAAGWVNQGVSEWATAICNKNPHTQKRCRQIKELPSAVANAANNAFKEMEKIVEEHPELIDLAFRDR